MKFDRSERMALDLDAIDLGILDLLQQNCKQSLAAIGEKVGLSASAVVERIHKLEEAGAILGYTALLDARRLGKDVTAFIGVGVGHPRSIDAFERAMVDLDEVLECHHVTGGHTMMLKVKTDTTATLERLIDRIRSVDGVTHTETMVVLSTRRERSRLALREVESDAAAVEEGARGASPARLRRLSRAEGSA